MQLVITGSGEDYEDKLVTYLLVAENDYFKGSIEFYGYANAFEDFSASLVNLPFESKKPVKFQADGIAINVSLADSAGRINFKTTINDLELHNSVEFNDESVEIEALQRLAKLLTTTNFYHTVRIQWDSNA